MRVRMYRSKAREVGRVLPLGQNRNQTPRPNYLPTYDPFRSCSVGNEYIRDGGHRAAGTCEKMLQGLQGALKVSK